MLRAETEGEEIQMDGGLIFWKQVADLWWWKEEFACFSFFEIMFFIFTEYLYLKNSDLNIMLKFLNLCSEAETPVLLVDVKFSDCMTAGPSKMRRIPHCVYSNSIIGSPTASRRLSIESLSQLFL